MHAHLKLAYGREGNAEGSCMASSNGKTQPHGTVAIATVRSQATKSAISGMLG